MTTPSNRRVLVVDDDALVRAYHSDALRPLGREIETAADGAAALAAIERELPAVVVTDREMPVMDGIVLLQRLRANPATATLPVLMVSSRRGPDDVRFALDSGADAFLGKPADAETLRLRVLGLLGEGA